jgi:hypothetical protein
MSIRDVLRPELKTSWMQGAPFTVQKCNLPNRGAVQFKIAAVVRGKMVGRIIPTTAVVELSTENDSTATAVGKRTWN